MRDPDATRQTILRKAGILFNTNGYKATSISEIVAATGFTKGAIYRHFENKDELERETLAFLSGALFERLRQLIRHEKTAPDKLRSVFRFFESYVTSPPFKGGCPLQNAAIEADDAHPGLRREALKTMTIIRQSLISILRNGIDHGQLKPGLDLEYYATIILASLEGGIMMSKLKGTSDDIRRVSLHLTNLVREMEL